MNQSNAVRLILTIFTLATSLSAHSTSYETVAFYVVAHEDDWQGLMNPSAYDDVTSPINTKVVFVYTTAGNADYGIGPKGYPYYLAREEGAKRAARFMADARMPRDAAPVRPRQVYININGHRVSRYSYRNTASYFIRLQDMTGLYLLRFGNSQSAIDGSARYLNWNDLTTTLEFIVRKELRQTGATSVRLNIPMSNDDAEHNQGDHGDHLNTGHAMDAVANRLPCASVARYYGYVIATRDSNLTSWQIINKSGVFGATISAIGNYGHFGTWDIGHLQFISRQYFETTDGDGSQCF